MATTDTTDRTDRTDLHDDDNLTSLTPHATDAGRISSRPFLTMSEETSGDGYGDGDDDDGGLRLVGDLPAMSIIERWEQRRSAAREQDERRRNAFHAAGGACWACRDTGHLRGDSDLGAPCVLCEAGRAVLTRLRAAWVSEQLRLAHVPQRMIGWSFATYPAPSRQSARQARRFAASWDGATGRGLLLKGDSSVGKSGLLVAAFRHVVERWADTLDDPRADPREGGGRSHGWFTTDASLLDALRDGYADGSAREVLRRAKTTRLLIVDDLGKADYREGQGWAAERLYEIINARYSELRPTWFSTNLGVEQLASRLGEMGEPVMERITDACDVLTITGAKLRGGMAR